MIETYLPFLLILMSWHPDDPQGTVSVSQRLFLDRATCQTAGEEVAARVKAEPSGGRRFAWVCQQPEREIEIYHSLRDQP